MVADAKHTPGPWVAEFNHVVARNPDGLLRYDNSIAVCHGPKEKAHARRIVACVNACEGIPTEALEGGVVGELVEAAGRYLQSMTRNSDDDPNCWAEEEYAEELLRDALAKVRGGEA